MSARITAMMAITLLLPALSLAQVVDADGDGVSDAQDLCPATPTGSTVDGAGCQTDAEFLFATYSGAPGGFLRSSHYEVGISNEGSLGTRTGPAGWHLTTGSSGMMADPAKDGWNTGTPQYLGDYFVPGTPEEGFGLSVDGVHGFTSFLMGEQGIVGNFATTTPGALRSQLCGQRGGASIYWSGTYQGIEIQQTYSMLNEGLVMLVEVTLTNTTNVVHDVYYLRNIDPDNIQNWTGDFDTQNTIVDQGGATGHVAKVTATTRSYPSYLALVSADPNARVSFGGFANRDPESIWNCTATGFCTPGDTMLQDEAISLAVYRQIQPGATTSFSYVYAVSDAEADTYVSCIPSLLCGDGQVVGTETCDDGNTVAGDGCDATCALESGWSCSGTPSVCGVVCGDGLLIGAEACDDGNAVAGDGCSDSCQIESGFTCTGAPSTCVTTCGDGVPAGAETCDDGNTDADDGCSDACLAETGYTCTGTPSACATICGDGVTAGAESCDDGNDDSKDGCSRSCAIEPGYQCIGAPSACATVCGDGVIAGIERCDDGNTAGGDGCDASCHVEAGFACAGLPSACMTSCGDGVIAGTEACDDDNHLSGDGCDSSCALEPGFTCSGSPSQCVANCGDGQVLGAEACDDGNTADGDGCSATCQLEPKPKPEPEVKTSGCTSAPGSAPVGILLLLAAAALIPRRRRSAVR